MEKDRRANRPINIREEMAREVSLTDTTYDMTKAIKSSPLPKLARNEFDFAPDGVKEFVEMVSGPVSGEINRFMRKVLSFNADQDAMEGLTVMGSLGLLKGSPICIAHVYSWYMESGYLDSNQVDNSASHSKKDKETQIPAEMFEKVDAMFTEYNPDFIKWFRAHANASALQYFDMMVDENSNIGEPNASSSPAERMVWDLHLMTLAVGYKSKVLDVFGMPDKDIWLRREITRISLEDPDSTLDSDRILSTLKMSDSFVYNPNMLRN